MHELTDLTIFAEVVGTRSFSAAAARLDVSKATVSKHISRLEKRLGTKLLNRTTRSVSLTEAGVALSVRCRSILAEADKAFIEIACLTGGGKGTLRVSAPVTIGIQHVGPVLAQFLTSNPDVSGRLILSNAAEDFLPDRFDVLVRIAKGADSRHVSQHLDGCPTVLCASPCYIQRSGLPQKPRDLENHSCLVFEAPPHDIWSFAKGDDMFEFRVEARLVTNNGEILRIGALAGIGVTLIPRLFVNDDIAQGRLNVVLEEYNTPRFDLYAYYPRHHHSTGHVIAFVKALAEHFKSRHPGNLAPMILDRLFVQRRSMVVSAAS